MTNRTTRSKKTTTPTSPRCARCDAVPSGCQCKKAASSITQRKSKAKAPLPVTLSAPVAARAAAGISSGAPALPLALGSQVRPAPEQQAAPLPPLGVAPSPSQAETPPAADVGHHTDQEGAAGVEEFRPEPDTASVQEGSLLSAAPTSNSQRRFLAPLSAPSQAQAEPTALELSAPSILNNDDADLDEDENEDLDEPENQKDLDGGDGGRLSEKASRILWLSTMDAIGYMEKQPEWKYIFDDRKRARIVREKYWRIVRD
ncbi:hypothetical protein CF326_g8011, partial [Tilletia indica]